MKDQTGPTFLHDRYVHSTTTVVQWYYHNNDVRTTMITTMNQLLGSLVVTNEPLPADESTTVAVRTADGRIFRIDNVYYDSGDGYVVVEIQDQPVEEPDDDKPAGKFGSGDPYDEWQCYSGTPGNRLMEQLFRSLEARLRDGSLKRSDVEFELEEGMNKIPGEYGAHDSEPRWAIREALDEVLYDLGFRKLWED